MLQHVTVRLRARGRLLLERSHYRDGPSETLTFHVNRAPFDTSPTIAADYFSTITDDSPLPPDDTTT